MRRVFSFFMVLGLLVGCGNSVGIPGDPSAPSVGGDISADEVAISVQKGMSSSGTPLFNVTFTNNSSVDISASAEFRLISGDTVVDDGVAFSPNRLEVGQSATDEVRFFEVESHDVYGCYTYDLLVFAPDMDNVNSDEKTYSTCE